MQKTIDYGKIAPGGRHAVGELEDYVRQCGLEQPLLELVRLRASQINGCAFCIDMHTKDARQLGESEQRLYGVSAWRDSPFYTERERAALEWAEVITKISEKQVPEEVYERVKKQFNEKELVDLTYAVIAINIWNRLAIPFHTLPGSYHPDSPVAIRKALKT